jgi:hypothetical protein
MDRMRLGKDLQQREVSNSRIPVRTGLNESPVRVEACTNFLLSTW